MRPGRIATYVLVCAAFGSCAGEAPVEEDVPQMLGESVVVEGGQYRDIVVPELQAMLADEDFLLVNVHIPFAGNIPETDESIPFNEIESNLDRLPTDRDARIVLYCRTGPMSEIAATELVRLGFTNVYNLVGGFMAWSTAGLPLAGQ